MKLFNKKYCLFLFFALISQVNYSQSSRLNLRFENKPVKDVINAIQDQTGFSIVYNLNDLDPNRKTTISVKNEDIISALNQLFRNLNITYTINDKYIVLSRKKDPGKKIRSIRGTVTDENGETLAGVNILVKDTTIGTITDSDGYFTLNNLPEKAELIFSYIGFKTRLIPIDTKTEFSIIMKENPHLLDEVIVTAMGIEKQSSTLTHANDNIDGIELTRIKSTNMINSLQGKSAGLIITPNATGAGGATKVLLRGNTSIMGNNQPLIVVDGIPLQNHQTSQINTTYGGQRDGGDAISNINPDDVENISILKSASAAALYGNMAANGVIMITTKKGYEGRTEINFTNNTTIETPLIQPLFQNEYGARKIGSSDKLETMSWGDKMKNPAENDQLNDFYRTGLNLNNSITISGGANNLRTYFSYANSTVSGIIPNNNFIRHILSFRQNLFLFNRKLETAFSANYINQNITNKHAGGKVINPLTGLYLLPRNDAIKNYREYEINGIQNWPYLAEDNQNPYWILNRMEQAEKRNRYIFSVSANWNICNELKLTGRFNIDQINDEYEKDSYASSYNISKGELFSEQTNNRQLFGDLLLSFTKEWNHFYLNLTSGSSICDINNNYQNIYINDEKDPYFSNWFIPENSKLNPNNSSWNRKCKISAFGYFQLGYKELAHLDITARNDWSSTLIDTNDKSYFYPSFGLNLHLDKIFRLPVVFNSIKLRGSYGIVGNDIPDQIVSPSWATRLIMSAGGSLTLPETAPFNDLILEKTYTVESGIDLVMLKNKLAFNFTVYKSNTKNQLFRVSAPWGSGYRYNYINAGNLQNKGFETALEWRQKLNKNWNWTTKFNLSYNNNKIKELAPGLDEQKLSEAEGFYTYLREGGSYGDVYVAGIRTEKDPSTGKDIVTKNVIANQLVGNLESDFYAGWSNTLQFKNLSLYFLVDGKFGGNVISITQGYLDAYGVSQTSADARNNGGVRVQNKTIDPKQYYNTVGQGPFAGNDYVYDATNIRLREISLEYTFRNIFGDNKNMKISLIGRNLFFFYKNAPVDPDVSLSTENGWQGIDCFALPSIRSYGMGLKLNF